MNDGIDSELCALSYISVEDVAKTILALGRGALMAKVDIRNAYRLMPMHPDERLLLGMERQCQAYVDMALPFELRSALTALADLLEWVFREGVWITWTTI